jgi:type I restriction enzyme S subunit
MKENNFQYKHTSKINWLSQIPIHWCEVRLGSLFNERKSKVSDIDYPPLSVTKNGIVPQLENAAKSNDGDNRKLVLNGDFVINSRSDRKGSSGLSRLDGSVSLINIVLRPIENIDPKFFEYLLKSYFFKEEYYRYGRGIVEDLWTTRYSEMKNMIVPKPPFEEQTAIARFLDYKLAKINRFIQKKKQLIKLLNEQKAAIINQAVTKGLDPNAKMKDSGIEWLGEIPEHWEVRKLKYSVRLNSHTSFENQESENTKIALENIESKTGRILELSQNAFEGIGTIFKKGDVLFGKLRPYLAKVATPIFEGNCVNEILVFTPDNRIWNHEYLKYRILASDFISLVDNSTYGSKMPRASWSFIGSIKLSSPLLSEQHQIVSFIEQETATINTTISKIEKELALTEEYKTALIAEAVTGKIDVRGYEVPEISEEETYEEIGDPDSYRDSMAAENEEEYQTVEE